MAADEPFLTMEEAADLLRVEGDRRGVRAWRQLRRLEKATGLEVLIDARGGRWLTTRSLIESTIPAMRARRTRLSALENQVHRMAKELESLKERVGFLE